MIHLQAVLWGLIIVAQLQQVRYRRILFMDYL